MTAPRAASPRQAVHEISAWCLDDLLFEAHRYAPGPAGADMVHVHDTYQFCLSLNFPGSYRYRGTQHPVPAGSLSVIHPGEAHAARDPADRPWAAAFRIFYAAPDLIQALAATIRGQAGPAPFFAEPVIADPRLGAAFLAYHQAAEAPTPRLETDTRLLALVAGLLRHGDRAGGWPRPGRERAAVARARDFLDAHFTENPSLADLARLSGLSPFHLARVFRAEVGLPPHAYLIAQRLNRARALLAEGGPVAPVATAAGFFDQSHLTHHFRRWVGVSPGRYARRRKNVQDAPRLPA